jgi:hypothetical protein
MRLLIVISLQFRSQKTDKGGIGSINFGLLPVKVSRSSTSVIQKGTANMKTNSLHGRAVQRDVQPT